MEWTCLKWRKKSLWFPCYHFSWLFFFPNRELFYVKFSMPDSPKFLHSCRQEVGRAASDLCGGTFALSVPRSQNVFPTQRLCWDQRASKCNVSVTWNGLTKTYMSFASGIWKEKIILTSPDGPAFYLFLKNIYWAQPIQQCTVVDLLGESIQRK